MTEFGPTKTWSPLFSGYGVYPGAVCRAGGRRSAEGEMMVYRPSEMAVDVVCFCAASVLPSSLSLDDVVVRGRVKSPRRITSVMRTVFPASVMFGVPAIRARRETL